MIIPSTDNPCIDKPKGCYDSRDESLHPEIKRLSGCTYAPHDLAMYPEYQDLVGVSVREQIAVDKWADAMRVISGARDRIRIAADPESLEKFGEDQRALLLAAEKQLGPFIGRAVRERNDHESAKEAADAKLSQMEREYRKAMYENE